MSFQHIHSLQGWQAWGNLKRKHSWKHDAVSTLEGTNLSKQIPEAKR